MTDLSEQEVEALRCVYQAIGLVPKSPFVIVGGWAARLLRRHPLATAPGYTSLQTADLDIAADSQSNPELGSVGSTLKQHGFVEDTRSEDRPPVTRYHLKQVNGFELEFIAPLRGGPTKRSGAQDATASIHGISAQKLRHVDILLLEPFLVALPELRVDAQLAVANPVSFIIQRLLIISSRTSQAKKGKDALYVHDVLQLFVHRGRLRPELVTQAANIWSSLTKKQQERCWREIEMLSDARSPAVLEAARIAVASSRSGAPSATAIALACRLSLNELLQAKCNRPRKGG